MTPRRFGRCPVLGRQREDPPGLLIQLDRAPETTSARALAMQIDRESRDELPVLPLWQLEDHLRLAGRTSGVPLEVPPITSIKSIAAWEVEPWFEKDPHLTTRAVFILAWLVVSRVRPPRRPRNPSPSPIDRQALRDPVADRVRALETRVDRGPTRRSILDDWYDLVHRRFVGPPWLPELVPGRGPALGDSHRGSLKAGRT